MNDDIDHLIEQGLGSRAEHLGTPTSGSLDDVFARVERRRSRRRSTAMLASVAIVAAGIGGLALTGSDDPAARSSASDDADNTMASEQVIGWQCSGQVAQFGRSAGFDDEQYTYWTSCEQVVLGDGVVLFDPVPTTAPSLPTPTTAVCQEFNNAGGVRTVPCDTPPPTLPVPGCDATDPPVVTDPACPAATSPPLDPTTTVPNGSVTDRDGRRVILYYVRSGDNPSRVAALWGVTVEELDATNTNNPNWETFTIGGEIWVPESGRLQTGPPPTTEYDGSFDDPIYSVDGPTCWDSDISVNKECALTDTEGEWVVEPGDSLSRIARRFRLTMETLIAYNEWPDGFDHLLMIGDVVLIPPFDHAGV